MATCAHSACTCEVPEGAQFCSPHCAEHTGSEECHCHHAECTAPHHH
jgi:hypothetical protein